MSAHPAIFTSAFVADVAVVGTRTVVKTRIDAAVFHFNLTVGAKEARWTLTSVRTRAGV
jgi:hypothetical protein